MKSNNRFWTISFLSIVFLFFLQLTTALIEAIYTVNLLGSSLNLYAAGIGWLLFPAFLFLVPLRTRIMKSKTKSPNSGLTVIL